MDKIKLKHKVSKDLDKLVKKALMVKFEEAAREIQNAIISEYDDELVDVVTDRNSKTNPNFYREEFIERLSEFSYIEENGNIVSLKVPDMTTFNFSGRLRVIEHIMEGMAGVYVEINEEDYVNVFNKKPINQDPLDEYVPPKEKIYLVRYTAKIRQAEKNLNKKFVRYPFSNTPPIRILEEGDRFVEENMDRWIEEALDEAQKTFVANYKGAQL